MLQNRIKHARKYTKMTQTELAKKLSVSQNAVHSWETRKTIPTPDTLEKIATALSLSLFFHEGTFFFLDTSFAPGSSDFNAAQRQDLEEELGAEKMEHCPVKLAQNVTDGEKKRLYEIQKESEDTQLKSKLDEAYNKLNPDGQKEAVKRVEELSFIPEYQLKPTTDTLADTLSNNLPNLSDFVQNPAKQSGLFMAADYSLDDDPTDSDPDPSDSK